MLFGGSSSKALQGGRLPDCRPVTRFTFRLESVRTLREQAEKQAKEELARELARKAERDAALSEAEERLQAAREAGALPVGSSLPAHELVSMQAFVERRERERLVAQADVSAADRDVGERQVQLEEAARERELLERLKKRKRAEHDQSVSRAEDAALGEMALAAHRRTNGNGDAAA